MVLHRYYEHNICLSISISYICDSHFKWTCCGLPYMCFILVVNERDIFDRWDTGLQ